MNTRDPAVIRAAFFAEARRDGLGYFAQLPSAIAAFPMEHHMSMEVGAWKLYAFPDAERRDLFVCQWKDRGASSVYPVSPGVHPLDAVATWAPGRFVDGPEYADLRPEVKAEWDRQERFLVRPSPKGNRVCVCDDPDLAAWVARRLNLAARYEARYGRMED